MFRQRKIAVGLSGGVDSSIALLLLKQQGFSPVGVFLKFACWKQAVKKAEKVCKALDVPFFALDCQKEFNDKVVRHFKEELKGKRTPNPCVFCNRNFKIKKLLEFAKKKNIEYVATGHYAKAVRVCHCEEGEARRGNLAGAKPGLLPIGRKASDPRCEFQLLKAKDKKKDQSYFLCLLGQSQLRRLVFPLGNYTKKQVYKIAGENKLEFLAEQKQSQDICFLSEQSLPEFLEKEIGIEPGDIVDARGNVLGKHKGLHFYTIGQRKGIDLVNGPWLVAGFDKSKNRLIVAGKEDNTSLYSRIIFLKNCNFISGRILKKKIRAKVKPRYQHPSASAVLHPLKNNRLKLVFDKPQKAIAPGQWAVFYNGEVCLGGGVIDKSS